MVMEKTVPATVWSTKPPHPATYAPLCCHRIRAERCRAAAPERCWSPATPVMGLAASTSRSSKTCRIVVAWFVHARVSRLDVRSPAVLHWSFLLTGYGIARRSPRVLLEIIASVVALDVVRQFVGLWDCRHILAHMRFVWAIRCHMVWINPTKTMEWMGIARSAIALSASARLARA
jgi:hypothetical protein